MPAATAATIAATIIEPNNSESLSRSGLAVSSRYARIAPIRPAAPRDRRGLAGFDVLAHARVSPAARRSFACRLACLPKALPCRSLTVVPAAHRGMHRVASRTNRDAQMM